MTVSSGLHRSLKCGESVSLEAVYSLLPDTVVEHAYYQVLYVGKFSQMFLTLFLLIFKIEIVTECLKFQLSTFQCYLHLPILFSTKGGGGGGTQEELEKFESLRCKSPTIGKNVKNRLVWPSNSFVI